MTFSGAAKCTFNRRGSCQVGVCHDSLLRRERKWRAFHFVVEKSGSFGEYFNLRHTLRGIFGDESG